jgi:hypothetical protein
VLKLFVLPDEAGCKVGSRSVEIVAEGPEGTEAHEGDQHPERTADEEYGGRHNEFRATYRLTCADAAKLASIDFPFFDRFANAQELEVTIIASNGQESYAVSRDSRRLERSSR